jgi:DNA-binding winged helix-turn-helix (wHTH) protein/Tfp pilus assembly protein PilF
MSVDRTRGYAFGSFRLYPEEALLLRSGQSIPLPPKTFKMLCVLVQNQGHVVDKESLMHEVWPDTFVVESNLRFNISMLRRALSDNGSSQDFIVTLPKRGYKFVGALEEIRPSVDDAFLPPNVRTPPGNGNETSLKTQHSSLLGDAQTEIKVTDAPTMGLTAQRSVVIGLAILVVAAVVFLIRVGVSSQKPISENGVWISRHASLSRNSEANDYFERGVRVLDRRTQYSATNGAIALEHAVALDPKFAVAHAHLAVAYGMRGDPHLGVEAAQRALALNTSLPEAHAALAFLATYYEWNWALAERELHKAIELDPSYPRGHQWLANLYQFERRFPEADKEMAIALKLDPQSPIINTDFCDLLFDEQKLDATIDFCQKTIAMDPDFISARAPLVAAYFAQTKYDKAAEVLIETVLKRGVHPEWPDQLRTAFQASGIRGLLEMDLQHHNQVRAPSFLIAQDQIRLGQKEAAFQTILEGYRTRDFFLPYIACDPEFAALRSDPRFMDVLHRMGLS